MLYNNLILSKCNNVGKIFFLITVTLVSSEWVEIPQASGGLEKGTKKIDFSAYILTTSTTMQTPIFAKPTTDNRKGQIKNVSVSMQNNNVGTRVASVKNVSYDAPGQTHNRTILINNTKEGKGKATVYKIDINAEEIDDDVFYEEDDDNNSDDQEEFTQNENIKNVEGDGYSYANFIPYMSVIQSILMKNAHNTKKSKVGVLQNLRDHLLKEIQNRITNLWKPQSTNEREAREYKEESHIDFPSNEAALMTIGFLTFAVFLIKLVLQLIQAIGNKMDNNNGNMTTTYIGRKRRSIDINEDASKILNYIDQYRFKNLDF